MTTRIWSAGGFVADNWHAAGVEDALPDSAPALVSLTRFENETEALLSRNAPLGVRLDPGEPLDAIVPHLDRLALVALAFPSFGDGRGFSTARLLREEHGYEGELRAVGDVLLDLVPFMLRCGFDSLEVSHGPTIKALAAGRIPAVDLYYQPMQSDAEAPAGGRAWARRPAAPAREKADAQ